MNILLVSVLLFSCLRRATAQSHAEPWSQIRHQIQKLGHVVDAELPITPPSISPESSSSPCTSTCGFLATLFGDSVIKKQQEKYWSKQQTETIPACRIHPSSAEQVATTILITQYFGCQFAVKSGGHACFAGASNIQGGLTIDLARLNTITTSEDETLTNIGSGNTWVDVYNNLSPKGLSVVGGRVSDIGVGGLTLGGGISFFSGRYGWALDNVKNYQTVVADGRILDVNEQSHPDLYFALRGGGNNFGIVTRFDLDTFHQGDLWGGSRTYSIAANASLLTAFTNFAHNHSEDVDAALIVNFVYARGMYLGYLDIEYARPVINPLTFHEITQVPYLSSSLRIASLPNLTNEINAAAPSGYREYSQTATFLINTALSSRILDIFIEEIDPLVSGSAPVAGLLPTLALQPVTLPIISRFLRRGGNSLGISSSRGPLMLVLVMIRWSSAADDARVTKACDNIINRAVQEAKELGLHDRFIYQNYAGAGQDVFGGYGKENLNRLRDISKRWDPSSIFGRRLQPGYFKLD